MKTVKFICNDIKKQQFAAALRKNVKDYFNEKGISTKGDSSLIIQTVAMLSIYILPFILLLTVKMDVWIAVILTVLMGIGMAGIGMSVMHGAVHGSYSSKTWVNKAFGGTMYLLGSHVLNWKIQHNILHHTYTNIDGYDLDIESRGPIRFSEHAPLRGIHRYQYIYAFFLYGLTTISKLIKDFTQLAEFNASGLSSQQDVNPAVEYVKMVLIKLTYLFAIIGLPLVFTDFRWWQIVIGIFIMHLTAGSILSTVFQMAHVVEGAAQPLPNEDGIVENEWSVHELQTTSDFARNNLFLNWYIGGLNFQIEHHLFPKICHVHYRKIAPIVEKTAREFGLVYNLKPTFLDALASHVKRLKELGQAVG